MMFVILVFVLKEFSLFSLRQDQGDSITKRRDDIAKY
jgi:hypothetical protein